MFEDLPRYQLRQLETPWKTAANAVHGAKASAKRSAELSSPAAP
jgi:hypothetical protein